MENKLEQLLNSLIEKGWKPFNTEEEKIYIAYRPEEKMLLISNDGIHGYPISLRDLTSIDCWLWKFVCENGMLETKGNVRVKNYWGDDECDDNCCDDDLEYWLMESALCDENKLEDFLLSNIKVDVKGD